jgi:CHAT domain-containing protein
VGTALREAVFDPLEPALAGRSRLFLALAGDLACLPFEVLPHPDGRPLLETHQLSYVLSGLDVLHFGAEPQDPPSPAVVAVDPHYDLFLRYPPEEPRPGRGGGNVSERLPRLSGTRRAGKRFAALLGVEPWLGSAVRKARFLELRSPRILHLGTHCRFTEEGASLALAGANGHGRVIRHHVERDDGLLAAHEIAGLDLHATELVVLPACDTTPGSAGGGASVLGLQRAFLEAGAATVVLSLWRVSAWHVKELLSSFYERILAGDPRAEALHQAQRDLRARYPEHARYWGAFICQGDPGPLRPDADAGRRGTTALRALWHLLAPAHAER